MKKIGIITFHKSDSYGASLQAYATLKALQGLGCDAELVDYTNAYEQLKHKPRGRGIKRILIDLKWQVSSRTLRTLRWLDRAFGERNALYEGHISEKDYGHSHEELDRAEYDILLAGSDQIWSGVITNGIDDAYLLGHGKAKKRISYASSMGSRAPSEEEKDIFRKCLSRFDAIGVREQFAKDAVSELTDKPVEIVCDPTLLLEREDWEAFTDKADIYRYTNGKKYGIAFYIGGFTAENMALTRKAKKRYDLPLYNIQKNARPRKGFDRCIAGVTVPEFAALIRNAEYVVTDSFHGTVLALIFGKQVLPLNNASNPVRVAELLKDLGLDSRIADPSMLDEPIDYGRVNIKMEEKRRAGREWLRKAIS